jgi:hypothetical protein
VLTTPIFRDPVCALHVAYGIKAQNAVPATAMRALLLSLMESTELMSRMDRDWLLRLAGQPSRVVNFSGMTSFEIHGQCVLITEAVRKRLPPCEADVIAARFAQDAAEKSAGVYGVVSYLMPNAPTSSTPALTDLVWRRYLPRWARGGFSLRDIAKRTHVSKSTLWRVSDWLDIECDGLELRALRRLEETFVPQGICDSMEMQQ